MSVKPVLNITIFAFLVTLAILAFYPVESSSYSSVLRVKNGEVIPFSTMIEELEGTDIVFVGELHDNTKHHRAQLDVIKGIGEGGTPLAVGLEMFKADNQEELNLWVEKRLRLDPFIRLYYEYWGLPWSLYRNIFLHSRDHGIPLVGLNVPKDITRKVLDEGFLSLSPDELRKLPPGVTCDDLDTSYMEFIRQAYDHHNWDGKDFTYFCEAQMVWDKSMAWYLIRYMNNEPGRTVVVLAGIGHSWKRGIPEQVARQSGYSFKVILPAVPGQIKNDTITTNDADYLLLQ